MEDFLHDKAVICTKLQNMEGVRRTGKQYGMEEEQKYRRWQRNIAGCEYTKELF